MFVELLSFTPDAEKLIEAAGRTCYLSFGHKTHDSYKKMIRMLIKNGHHSVLEHASATFRITGGSRSFTHQLVRHRLCSYSQQSQRYVNENCFSIITPPSIIADKQALVSFRIAMKNAQLAYAKLIDLGIKKEDARFVLPNACESKIVISANYRELRHIFDKRCDKAAQWEIRAIAMDMLGYMKNIAPIVFEDYEIDEEKNCLK